MKTRFASFLMSIGVAACGGAAPHDSPDASVPPAADASPHAADAAITRADAAPGTPDARPPQTCSPWKAQLDTDRPAGATASAVIANGQLVLTSDGARDGVCGSDLEPCADLTLSQQTLTGDFDVTVDVASLEGTSLFDRLDLFVVQGNQYYMPYQLIAVGHGSLQYEGDGASHDSWSTGASTSTGTLRIQRTGDRIALTATFGGAILKKDNIYFSGDATLGLALELGAPPVAGGDHVSAHVDGITITGGGGAIQSDAFDGACDLLP